MNNILYLQIYFYQNSIFIKFTIYITLYEFNIQVYLTSQNM